MNNLSGVAKRNQKRITAIYKAANHAITVEEAAAILKMSQKDVAKLMSRWVEQGWFSRIKRGLYVPTIKANENELPLNDPWIIATKIYGPCYIGALNAAEHWGLTNQKISRISILTTRKPRNRNLVISSSASILVRTIPQQAMFGLESIVHDQTEVMISDPSRTIIDFMLDPELGGGIDNIFDVFNAYLKSEHRNVDLLFNYAKKMLNGAVLKRLGFLLERCQSGESNIIWFCRTLKTDGYIKLDPKKNADKLITRWGLWIPDEWVNKV